MFIRRLTAAAALMSFLGGCEGSDGGTSGAGDGTGTGGTTSTGDSTTEGGGEGSDEGPGYTPDPQACVPKTCAVKTVGEDCCEGVQPGIPSACPGTDYPNNWSCVNNMCVHGGCTNDADCVIPGFDCVDLGGVSQCVAVCTVPSGGTGGGDCEDCDDCDDPEDGDADGIAHFMPGTECIGVAAGGVMYCAQPLP